MTNATGLKGLQPGFNFVGMLDDETGLQARFAGNRFLPRSPAPAVCPFVGDVVGCLRLPERFSVLDFRAALLQMSRRGPSGEHPAFGGASYRFAAF